MPEGLRAQAAAGTPRNTEGGHLPAKETEALLFSLKVT